MSRVLDRRQVLRGASLAGGGLALSAYMPAWAQPVSAGIATPLPTVSGEDITLKVAHQMMMIDGRQSHAIGINGTVPAPLIRLREGTLIFLLQLVDQSHVSPPGGGGASSIPPARFGVAVAPASVTLASPGSGVLTLWNHSPYARRSAKNCLRASTWRR